jgi:DNA-binding Lrp family transcriptional regulator
MQVGNGHPSMVGHPSVGHNGSVLRTGGDSLRLDEIDRGIVARLVDDARSSFRAIGEAVGLSAPAVKRRVDRLEEAGVIRGYSAVVDLDPDRDRSDAFIELFCRAGTSPDDVRAAVAPYEQVVAGYTVTGEADALLRVRTGGMAELEAVLEGISAHAITERTRSFLVLSRLLERAEPVIGPGPSASDT